MAVNSQQYWDEVFTHAATEHSLGEVKGEIAPALRAAAEFFGPMQGKTVIDLGCGDGASSLFFAKQGANVVSLDQSTVAIQRLREFCTKNNIRSIKAFAANAFDVETYGPVDFIFGSMILHHLEPFAEFVPLLKRALQPNGRSFFYENNSASSLLVWSRKHLVGKLWIPKHGDSDEFPLTTKEVQELAGAFRLQQQFPELCLFRLIPAYMFNGHLEKPFQLLDELAFRVPALRKYSYRQYLFLENR